MFEQPSSALKVDLHVRKKLRCFEGTKPCHGAAVCGGFAIGGGLAGAAIGGGLAGSLFTDHAEGRCRLGDLLPVGC